MIKIKLNYLDYVLITLGGMGILSAAVRMISKGNYDSNIATICWILTAMGWFYLSKRHEAKLEALKQQANIDQREASIRAINSAPSQLTTHEKTLYEYGFTDGVNFVKKEIEKVA
jgi:hypothetical protein